MKFKPYKFRISSIGTVSFWLLFPGFFFYHSLLALHVIPPTLGGYFAPVASLVVVPAFAAALAMNRICSLRLLASDYLFFALSLYTIFIGVFNYLGNTPSETDSELLVWTLTGTLFNIVMWSIGRLLHQYRSGFIAILMASIAGMLVVTYLNIGDRNIFALGIRSTGDDLLAASYQSFARSFAVTTIVVTATLKRPSVFFLFIAIGLVGLYWIGARSEFVGFLFACGILAFAKYGEGKTALSLMLLSIAFIFVLLIDSLSINLGSIEGNRMLQLIRLDEARSVELRNENTVAAINTISSNPFLGDYGSYANYGSIGDYSHNLLSAWVNLGLIGFALYVLLLSLLARQCILLLRGGSNSSALSPATKMGIAFTCYSILLVIFAKDYSLMTIGFSVGLLSAAKYSSQPQPTGSIQLNRNS